jgi:serine/threonine protein phosphatase 1
MVAVASRVLARDREGPLMSRSYAIPDLHGRYDLLDAAIEKILDHSRGHETRIITLGDYIDRGPNSRQVMEHLVNWSCRSLR